ncbi:MAG TPA: hypothetical protein VNT54_18280, partial [Solirubrobacteraceae bacterium]|nr:hypothetical protein [Solirubrobacteraceae bacterium]
MTVAMITRDLPRIHTRLQHHDVLIARRRRGSTNRWHDRQHGQREGEGEAQTGHAISPDSGNRPGIDSGARKLENNSQQSAVKRLRSDRRTQSNRAVIWAFWQCRRRPARAVVGEARSYNRPSLPIGP